MGKYFDLNAFKTEFNKLLGEEKDKRAEKGALIEYKDAQITQIHEHLFGDEKNDKLIYSIPAYFLDAAQDIIENKFRKSPPKISKDGKIYDGDKLLNALKKNEKEYIFVLTQNNELLIEEANLNRGKDRRLNHSSLAGHKPVKMAGTITVEDGIIKTITNESGHFMPSKENFEGFLRDYVNAKKLTLWSQFKAKYVDDEKDLIGITDKEIASLLGECNREALQQLDRFSRAERSLDLDKKDKEQYHLGGSRGFLTLPSSGGFSSAPSAKRSKSLAQINAMFNFAEEAHGADQFGIAPSLDDNQELHEASSLESPAKRAKQTSFASSIVEKRKSDGSLKQHLEGAAAQNFGSLTRSIFTQLLPQNPQAGITPPASPER